MTGYYLFTSVNLNYVFACTIKEGQNKKRYEMAIY